MGARLTLPGTAFPSRRLDAVPAFLRDALADPETGWSLGGFGALAEFRRDPEEPVSALADGRLGLATARGAIALRDLPGLRPVAYETAFGRDWSHAVALCLPEAACAMGRRRVLTELGPDAEAARPEDRGGVLFDLGLGLAAADACLRTRDPATLAALRASAGRSVLDADVPVLSRLDTLDAHRLFVARIGRIELFAPPGAGPGPRSFIVPRLLRGGRTHAATASIPAGLVPPAACHPPHPCKDREGRRIAYRPERHAAFQALLARWGDPRLLAIKRAVEAGDEPGAADRQARNALRVAHAQALCRPA